MTQIFISHHQDDAACAAQIRGDLEAQDYVVWQEAQDLTPGSVSYPGMIENGIRGSAAVIVVWSASAARSEWAEREILFAQRLKKPLFPVITDGTDLPITLVNVQSITAEPSCTAVVAGLLPHLPPPDSDDVLIALLAQLSHPYIRERKAGIARAAALLEKEAHREEVLALLEDVARKDLMLGVRQEAQAVLDAEARKEAPPPPRGAASRHVFGVRCPKGHVTYFDRRRVCPASGTFVRRVVRRADAELDEIRLKCGAKGCDQEMVVPVDCEGYK